MTGRRTRRQFLAVVGTTGLLSGCLRLDDDGNRAVGGDDTPTAEPSLTDSPTAIPTETPIHIGSILPITGALSDFGPGMREGVKVAVEEINDAGGPNGAGIVHHAMDSGTSSQQALNSYNSLVSDNEILGFVGAASSGVSAPLARHVASDKVFQCSPSSTSPMLAEFGYEGDTKYVGRTAPNDGQQGVVMGRILNRNTYVGADTAAFLHVNNGYGEGLAMQATEAFNGETLRLVPYSSKTSDYTSTLDTLFRGDPDAIGFVGYPESAQRILQTWADGGYGGQWVLSEGLNSSHFFSTIPDVVEGMYVSSPSPEQTTGAQRFADKISGAVKVFSPHSYDATFLMALAIHKAGEATGEAIATNIRSVSRPSGERVTVGEFGKAKAILDEGGSVNYEGASSPVELNRPCLDA